TKRGSRQRAAGSRETGGGRLLLPHRRWGRLGGGSFFNSSLAAPCARRTPSVDGRNGAHSRKPSPAPSRKREGVFLLLLPHRRWGRLGGGSFFSSSLAAPCAQRARRAPRVDGRNGAHSRKPSPAPPTGGRGSEDKTLPLPPPASGR